jgi:hypothetical protein
MEINEDDLENMEEFLDRADRAEEVEVENEQGMTRQQAIDRFERDQELYEL